MGEEAIRLLMNIYIKYIEITAKAEGTVNNESNLSALTR